MWFFRPVSCRASAAAFSPWFLIRNLVVVPGAAEVLQGAGDRRIVRLGVLLRGGSWWCFGFMVWLRRNLRQKCCNIEGTTVWALRPVERRWDRGGRWRCLLCQVGRWSFKDELKVNLDISQGFPWIQVVSLSTYVERKGKSFISCGLEIRDIQT